MLQDWKVPLLGKKPEIWRSYEIAGKIQTDAVFDLDLLHHIHYINLQFARQWT